MAETTIGRADYELGVDKAGVKKGLAETDQLVKSAGKKTEDEFARSGEQGGARMGAGVKTGLKLIGGAAAGAFGLATKGLLELENITADFQATTGATAEEADKAGDAINRMAGRNMQPMREIGKTMGEVVTKLGLTGEAAEDTTQQFLTFARATKQDAAAAVGAFDDILDSFNLEAKDSGKIMDALVASSQKYGGSITENQSALAKMAPQLKALNLGWEDGVSLLNLYADSGLDASAGQMALNTAIQKLPDGTSMKDFIAKLASIEDPALRADAAIEVFGSRAGAKMANAIKPGMDSLDDFAISAEEAAGKTQAAADAIDGTFTNQVMLRIKGFTSAITGIGKEIGPVATSLAGLSSLAATMFDTGTGKKITSALAGAIKAGGEKGTALLGQALSATGIDRLAKTAGAKIGALWGVAMAGGTKVAELLGASLMKLPGVPAIKAAAIGAGTTSGGAFATAFGVGALLAIPLLIAGVLAAIGTAVAAGVEADVRAKVQAAVTTGSTEAAAEARRVLDERLRSARASHASDAWIEFLVGQKAELEAGLTAAVVDPLDEAREASRIAAQQIPIAVSEGIAQGAPAMAGSVTTAYAGMTEAARLEMDRLQAETAAGAKRVGNLAGEGVAQGILDSRSKPKAAWDTFLEMLKNSMSPAKETARLLGQLTSEKLVEGLKSKDPAVRAQAAFVKQTILDRLVELGAGSHKLSKEAAAFVEKGLKSKDPEIKAAALAIKTNTLAPLKEIPPKARIWGERVGGQYAAGLNSQERAVAAAAANIGQSVQNFLRTHSPAKMGPLSLGGGPGGWGKKSGQLWSSGLLGGLDVSGLQRALGGIAGMLGPNIGSILPTNASAPFQDAARVGTQFEADRSDRARGVVRSGPTVIHGGITIQFAEPVDFGRQNPRDIARELAQELRLTLARSAV